MFSCVCAGDHVLSSDIAKGFRDWKYRSAESTALGYAQYLAMCSDEQSKKKAQAIIFYGAGFGGFAKNCTATTDEVNQYFSTIQLLKGLMPKESDIGNSGREDVTYHQQVLLTLSRQRDRGSLSEATLKFKGEKLRNIDQWLEAYSRHKGLEKLKNLWDEKKFKRYNELSQCCYDKEAIYPAAVNIHQYDNFSAWRPCVWRSKEVTPPFFINVGGVDENFQLLLHPHGYMGKCAKVGSGGKWDKDVHASIAYVDKKWSINGNTHIHDNVASPNNMGIGNAQDLLAKGFFVSSIIFPYSVKTLHLLIPVHATFNSLYQTIGVNELLNHLVFKMGHDTHKYVQFLIEQLS